jgi:hypothetical protein
VVRIHDVFWFSRGGEAVIASGGILCGQERSL